MQQERSEPQKRKCCDRCRSQKLRCAQLGRNDSCNRCQRLQIPCVYSVPLKKGRPKTRLRPIRKTASLDSVQAPPVPPVQDVSLVNTNAIPSRSDFDTSINPCTLLDGTMGFNFDLQDGDSFPSLSLGLDQSWFWNPLWVDPTTSVQGQTYHNASGSSCLSTTDSSSLVGGTTIDETRSVCTTERRNDSLPKLWPVPSNDMDRRIKVLSELSTRLYPVYKLSRRFPTLQQEYKGPVITTAAFFTMNVFLGTSNPADLPKDVGCRAIYEIFSASRDFLDVLHQLQQPKTSSAASSAYTNDSTVYTTPSEQDGEIDEEDDAVIYLVLACYSRLLYIYSASIAALQHDACHAKHPGPASSIELRLVVLVNLISHFSNQLRETTSRYMTHIDQKGTLISGSVDSGHRIDDRAGSLAVLETEVWHRLQQLQNTLYKGSINSSV